MTCHTSATDVVACLLLSAGLFGASLVPFFLLVNAEHLTPGWLRKSAVAELAAVRVFQVRQRVRLAACDALLGLVLLLNFPNGATR